MTATAPRGPSPLAVARGFFGRAPEYLTEVARRYGDVAALPLGPFRMLLVSHPDLIDQVLGPDRTDYVKAGMARGAAVFGQGMLTSEGAFHDRQRRLAQPAFGEGPLATYLADVPGLARAGTAGWSDGAPVDVGAAMQDITARVITRAMFGAGHGARPGVPSGHGDASAAFEDGMAADLAEQMSWLNRYPEQLAPLDRLPLPANARLRRARSRVVAQAREGIAARRGQPPEDLLGWLLAGKDGDGSAMTDEAAVEEVQTLLIAAHERTAMALTWTLWLLSEHPAAREQLEAELDEVLAGRAPDQEDLPRLPFTQAVLAEGMRLYPPIWVFARQPVAETQLGGVSVRHGTWLLISAYVTHRDPRFWADAGSFRPERWLGSGADADRPGGAGHPAAYLPFGRGARGCLGQQFARRTCALVLATLAARWRLLPVPGQGPGGLQPTITLRPKRPIVLRLATRAPARRAP